MINILIVTHGKFGEELIKSAEIIIGKIENIESISFMHEDSYSKFYDRVEDTVKKLKDKELIIFTDMYGGSPFNAVNRLMKEYDFYHITGVNFPLFVDITVNRTTYNMEELADKIIKNGKKSIVFVNDKFKFD